MAHVEIVDQTTRDGPQSLWGMRIRAGTVADIAPWLGRAGYRTIEVIGGSFFSVLLRYLREDPIEAYSLIRRSLRGSTLRGGVRPSSSGRYGLSPYSILDFYNQFMARLGEDEVWVYDCLYNMPEMRRRAQSVYDTGCTVILAVMYGLSPVHTDEWFAERVREMVSWGLAKAIYIEDAPGILTPDRTATLIPAIVKAAGELPVELHCHNTTGLAPLNYLVGVEHGVQRIHTCSRPMANGVSLPSTEMMLVNLQAAGHTHDIDESTLAPVAERLEAIARAEGHPVGEVYEYDARVYDHQLPGGMTGTFKAQLVQHGMQDRWGAVLEEIPRVREELGYPVSATPFSQHIGTQAVLNVVSDERYAVTSDELVLYMLGAYGEPPIPVQQDVKDRVLSTQRGRELAGWTRPEQTLDQVRAEYGGKGCSDEDLFRLHFAPPADVEATRAAGPIRTSYRFPAPSLTELTTLALAASRARRLRLRTPELSFDVSRP
ncbi:MAG TPA: hypothetical protein VHX88_18890 [Solirubrobacteraceae bacterium]|jgi:oxaloacetate decarboxylase alpha subunit|nr:hypothetical protein [Solirubrobacteraceae bacterium]